MTSELLQVADLPLAHIFSFLSLEDLKNVRLVSSRLSEDVMKLDKRFGTWNLKLPRDLTQDTHKVFHYNVKLKVEVYKVKNIDQEDLETWLIKHTSCITALQLEIKDSPEHLAKLLKPLTILDQLKSLELRYLSQESVKALLQGIGSRLESLTVRNLDSSRSQLDYSTINLTKLKHLKLIYSDKIIPNILQILPTTIESLHLELWRGLEYLELPPTMKQLKSLKYLKLRCYYYRELIHRLLCIVPATLETLDIHSHVNLEASIDEEEPDPRFINLPLAIYQLSNLRRLKLNGGEELISNFLNVVPTTNIEIIDIETDSETVQFPSHLLELENLKELKLSLIDKNLISSFLKVMPPTVGVIDIKTRTDSGHAEMPNLMKSLKCLKKLRLESDNDFISSFLKFIPCASLEVLDLKSTGQADGSISLPSSKNLLNNLKHLKLQTDNETIASFLSALPATIQVLDLESDKPDIHLPSTVGKLGNLKTLRVTYESRPWYPNKIDLKIGLLSTSLTRLYLHGVDIKEQTDTDLPSLKVMGISRCQIEMKVLKTLLRKSRESLNMLILESTYIEEDEDLDFTLPALTTIGLLGMVDQEEFLPQLFSACSGSLTTLMCYSVDLYDLNQLLACDLPALKVLSIEGNMGGELDLNHLLRKCSACLQILHLAHMDVNFEVHVPSLKELYLNKVHIEGLGNLLKPQGSKIVSFGLQDASGYLWGDTVEFNFPDLEVIFMSGLHFDSFGNPEEHWTLEQSIKKAQVHVFSDNQEEKWRILQFRYFQDAEFEKTLKFLSRFYLSEDSYTILG